MQSSKGGLAGMAHHPQLIAPDSGIMPRLMRSRHGAPASRTGCSVRSNRIWPTQAHPGSLLCDAASSAQAYRRVEELSRHTTSAAQAPCRPVSGFSQCSSAHGNPITGH